MRTNLCVTIMLIGLVFVTAIPVTITAGELAEEEKIMAEPPGPEGPWPKQRFEMQPEHIERMLQQIREEDPQRADELVRLREQDPDAFMDQMRNIAREHFQKEQKESPRWQRHGPQQQMGRRPRPSPEEDGQMISREQMQEKHEEYLKWLQENYPDETAQLQRVREETPDQYFRALGVSLRKRGRLFQASKDNPELAEALKRATDLKKRRMELLEQIKTTTNEDQKQALTNELKGVVSEQFDLIVLRKEFAYEHLAQKLQELQKEVEQRKAEVEKWKNPDFKNEQVEQRVQELVNETEKFEWE